MNAKLSMRFYLALLWLSLCICQETQAYCSLDKMKKFAMEACEHLFLSDEGGRERRSPGYEYNLIDKYGYKNFFGKRHIMISRSVYPTGGYLKVGHEHFRKLSKVDVIPKYKQRKMHHEKKQRFKREQPRHYNNIPYCCYHRCDEDFFC